MDDRCSRCGERYPSHYYFLAGVVPAVCNRCVSGLPDDERDELLNAGAKAAGQELHRCLRCQGIMMRGELAYRDRSPNDAARIGEMSWVLARRQAAFLGLLSDWVIDKALTIDAWRCGGCGYVELSSEPDPTPGRRQDSRARRMDQNPTLL